MELGSNYKIKLLVASKFSRSFLTLALPCPNFFKTILCFFLLFLSNVWFSKSLSFYHQWRVQMSESQQHYNFYPVQSEYFLEMWSGCQMFIWFCGRCYIQYSQVNNPLTFIRHILYTVYHRTEKQNILTLPVNVNFLAQAEIKPSLNCVQDVLNTFITNTSFALSDDCWCC